MWHRDWVVLGLPQQLLFVDEYLLEEVLRDANLVGEVVLETTEG